MEKGKRVLAPSSDCPIILRGHQQSLRDLTPSTVHHLPFGLAYDGVCPVDSFFRIETLSQPSISGSSTESPTLYISTFRGRKLLGHKLDLDSIGASGSVWEQRRHSYKQNVQQNGKARELDTNLDSEESRKRLKREELHEEEGDVERERGGILEEREEGRDKREWECQAVFKEMTTWNVDMTPTEMDEARRWVEWFDIAQAIHSPVSSTS